MNNDLSRSLPRSALAFTTNFSQQEPMYRSMNGLHTTSGNRCCDEQTVYRSLAIQPTLLKRSCAATVNVGENKLGSTFSPFGKTLLHQSEIETVNANSDAPFLPIQFDSYPLTEYSYGFSTVDDIKELKQSIEKVLSANQIDFRFKANKFKYKCMTVIHSIDVSFSIYLFKLDHADKLGEYLIEFQCTSSNCGFLWKNFFLEIATALNDVMKITCKNTQKEIPSCTKKVVNKRKLSCSDLLEMVTMNNFLECRLQASNLIAKLTHQNEELDHNKVIKELIPLLNDRNVVISRQAFCSIANIMSNHECSNDVDEEDLSKAIQVVTQVLSCDQYNKCDEFFHQQLLKREAIRCLHELSKSCSCVRHALQSEEVKQILTQCSNSADEKIAVPATRLIETMV